MHHIINRARVPKDLQDDIPREYMAMLCNDCNLKADTNDVRYTLIQANAFRFGIKQMRQVLYEFNKKLTKNGMSEMTWVTEILDKVEQERKRTNPNAKR